MRTHESSLIGYLTIASVWCAMAFFANPIGDFPLIDDWVYALAVKSVLQTGEFRFPSGTLANVGPQVYWGALFCLPFGFSFTALRFSTLALGLIGLIALYALIREVGGNRRVALVGALVLAVNPLYFGLANSFMTDVPFVALVVVSLYYLVRGIQRDSRLDLALGLLITFAAILVRQLSLVVLMGFAVAYPMKNGFRFANLARALVPLVLGILLHVLYQRWLVDTGRIPGGPPSVETLIPASVSGFVLASLRGAFVAMMYVGLLALPFVAVFPPNMRREQHKERTRLLVAACMIFAGSALGYVLWQRTTMPLSGNILVKSGLGPLLVRDTVYFGINYPQRPIAVDVLWIVATVLAIAGACSVIHHIAVATRRSMVLFQSAGSRPGTWLYAFVAVMSVCYMAIVLVVADRLAEGNLYDRYLMLFVPLFMLVVCANERDRPAPPRRLNLALAAILICAFAGFSVAATHDSLAWNRARWIATNRLLVDGIRPNQIDGGYEFNGWYLFDSNYVKKPGKSWWWVDDDEYVIASGPLDGYVEVRRYSFSRWLLFSKTSVFVLKRTKPG